MLQALLDWPIIQLHQLDVKFRKLLSINGAHHIRADVDCLDLPRNMGGRGFICLSDVVECKKRLSSCYLHSTKETLLQCGKDILKVPILGTIDDFMSEVCQQRLFQWRNKEIHGEFLEKAESGGEFSLSFNWLVSGQLKMTTEAQTMAAQDQTLPVRAVQNCIYRLSVQVNCTVCGDAPEYVDLLLSSCTPLAATMYKQRDDRVVSIIHWSILKQFKQKVSQNYSDHTPTEDSVIKVIWDFKY